MSILQLLKVSWTKIQDRLSIGDGVVSAGAYYHLSLSVSARFKKDCSTGQYYGKKVPRFQ